MPLVDPGLAVAAAGVGNLLKPFLKKPADDVSEILAHFTTRKLKNLLGVGEQAERMLAGAQAEAKEVPLRVMVPLMDAAGNEDDPSMQARWAALLANASTASADEIPPAFPRALAQMTQIEARVLDALSQSVPIPDGHPKKRTARAGVLRGPRTGYSFTGLGTKSGMTYDLSRLSAAIDLLESLSLAKRTPMTDSSTLMSPGSGVSSGEIESDVVIRITEFGRRFLKACQPPTRATPT